MQHLALSSRSLPCSSEQSGVALFAAQQLCFAAETVALHGLGASHAGVSVMQIAALRSAGGLVLAIGLARTVPWHTAAPWWQAARGTASLVYLVIFIAVYQAIPLADATAISFLQPLFLVIYGAVWFGETVRRVQWMAAVIGFAAAMLVVRPSFAGTNPLYLIALAGAAINAAVLAMSRPIGRHDSPYTILFYASALGLFASGVGAYGQPLPPFSPWLFGIACGPLGQLFGIIAVRHAGVATVAAAAGFLRLPAALLLGFCLFGESPDIAGIAGAAMIVAAGLLALRRP
jgi:drug/metabolite transporter (DMT)-like permease